MSRQTTFKKYDVLGVQVDALTINQASDYICELAGRPGAHYVVKPYSEFIERVNREPALAPYLNGAELCLPDGVALCWATAFLYGGGHHWWRVVSTLAALILKPASAYRFLPEKFGGTNATWNLLELASARQLKVFLIGSPYDSSLDQVKAAIQHRLPEVQVVGQAPGEVNGLRRDALRSSLEAETIDLSALASQISASKADLILVGMGFPLQEVLMSKLAPHLTHGVMVGEGGTFDYQSFGGRQPKAPRWLQNVGLEWLWRLILQPKRLKRQLAIPRLIWRVYRAGRPASSQT